MLTTCTHGITDTKVRPPWSFTCHFHGRFYCRGRVSWHRAQGVAAPPVLLQPRAEQQCTQERAKQPALGPAECLASGDREARAAGSTEMGNYRVQSSGNEGGSVYRGHGAGHFSEAGFNGGLRLSGKWPAGSGRNRLDPEPGGHVGETPGSSERELPGRKEAEAAGRRVAQRSPRKAQAGAGGEAGSTGPRVQVRRCQPWR